MIKTIAAVIIILAMLVAGGLVYNNQRNTIASLEGRLNFLEQNNASLQAQIDQNLKDSAKFNSLVIPDTKIKVVFPVPYTLAKITNEPNRRGSFLAYDFKTSDNKLPTLGEIQFFSETSIAKFIKDCKDQGAEMCFEGSYPNNESYKAEKQAFKDGKAYKEIPLVKFGDRSWFVNMEKCSGDACYIREYSTFMGDTLVSVMLVLNHMEEADTADKMFLDVKLESVL